MKSRNPSLLSNSQLPRRAAALPKRPNFMILPFIVATDRAKPAPGRWAPALADRARRPLPPKPCAHRFSHYEFHVASLEPGQFLREHSHALPVRTRHAGNVGAPEAPPWTEGVEYLLKIRV